MEYFNILDVNHAENLINTSEIRLKIIKLVKCDHYLSDSLLQMRNFFLS